MAAIASMRGIVKISAKTSSLIGQDGTVNPSADLPRHVGLATPNLVAPKLTRRFGSGIASGCFDPGIAHHRERALDDHLIDGELVSCLRSLHGACSGFSFPLVSVIRTVRSPTNEIGRPYFERGLVIAPIRCGHPVGERRPDLSFRERVRRVRVSESFGSGAQ